MVADPVSDLLSRIHGEIAADAGGRVASYIPELGVPIPICSG